MVEIDTAEKLSPEERRRNIQFSLWLVSTGCLFTIILVIWGMFRKPSLTPVMIYLLFVVVIGQIIFLNYIKNMLKLIDSGLDVATKSKVLLRKVFNQLMVAMISSLIGLIIVFRLIGWI
ncbi:MAG: hypothetical protein JSV09_04545 [Thermoplasmata archaeon]|nr:MAG: hypothetical protein JSV09_04545 [Thermoplasmata archaeon]